MTRNIAEIAASAFLNFIKDDWGRFIKYILKQMNLAIECKLYNGLLLKFAFGSRLITIIISIATFKIKAIQR